MGVTIQENVGTPPEPLGASETRARRDPSVGADPAGASSAPGRGAIELGLPPRSDPTVRAVARRWRRLTSPTGRRIPDAERRTLLAVSGGADSVAMLLALCAATGRDRAGLAGVCHVVHDLRAAEEACADRDAVSELAGALSLPFHERRLVTDPADNAERSAREGRYRALADVALQAGASFVATGHHADDQLESIVMGLARGAGLDGLRGIAASRVIRGQPGRVAEGSGDQPCLDEPGMAPDGVAPDGTARGGGVVTLIRPCLGVTRAEAERLCRVAGVAWRVDATNADTTRLRAALRHGALRELGMVRPEAARRAAASAELLGDAAGLVHDRAREVFGDELEWPRERLRGERAIVIGAGLRGAALRLTGGMHGDALTSKTVGPAVDAIRDRSTEARVFDWAGGLRLTVGARRVALERRAP